MENVVLDASALLAMLFGERGGEGVEALLLEPEKSTTMSALNWSEVFDRLLREGYGEEEVEGLLTPLAIEVIDFTRAQARMAAGLRIAAPALSLADRACLGLATTTNASAWTADKMWTRVKTPARVHLVR
ncbi:MAG TPA: type II toxin-antitoxin system VapC family toxin [Terracidiphilus sp.]|jgi:PIN domain nuclease of toxin-antitoxin system